MYRYTRKEIAPIVLSCLFERSAHTSQTNITEDARLEKDLKLDINGLEYVEVLLTLEEHFDVHIEDKDAQENIETAAQLISYIHVLEPKKT